MELTDKEMEREFQIDLKENPFCSCYSNNKNEINCGNSFLKKGDEVGCADCGKPIHYNTINMLIKRKKNKNGKN